MHHSYDRRRFFIIQYRHPSVHLSFGYTDTSACVLRASYEPLRWRNFALFLEYFVLVMVYVSSISSRDFHSFV